MTQQSYDNYINIIRGRMADMSRLMTEALFRGDYSYYKKIEYDLSIIDASLELMEEYQLPIEILIAVEGYENPNFLTHLEMQDMNSLVQELLNTSYQVDFLLDTPDGFIIDDNYNPIVTSTGTLLVSSGGETGYVFLKDALKNPVNVEYIYATVGYKLDGGEDNEVLTSDEDGLGTFEEAQGGTGSSGLEYDIESTENVGGINQGDLFEDESSITDLLNKLLVDNKLKGLTYPGYSSLVYVGTRVEPASFSWTVEGSYNSLTFSDTDASTTSKDVTGLTTTQNTHTYILDTNGTITWRVTGDNGDSTTASTTWVYPSYYGSNLDGLLPSELDIDENKKVKANSASSVTFPIRTTSKEYGWFLVDKLQTGRSYTTWYIDGFNNDDIGEGATLIKNTNSTLTYNGREYDIYMTNYNGQISKNIKLS